MPSAHLGRTAYCGASGQTHPVTVEVDRPARTVEVPDARRPTGIRWRDDDIRGRAR